MSKIWWGVSVLAGLVMLYALTWDNGISKLMGAEYNVTFFTETIGFGVVLMYVAGIAETAGPLMMLHWKTSFWGALLVTFNSLVALCVVYSLGNGLDTELLSYIVMGGVVGWKMRPGFLRKKPKIETISI